MPKVSIIIPAYNSMSFIKRTIESVQRQTYTDWELLVVDDQSTDNTVNLVREYIKNDSQIRLIEVLKNFGGPAGPKNIGIREAKGTYIAFLDHDDEWLPEKLSEQVCLFDNASARVGFVGCRALIVDKKGIITKQEDKFFRGNVFRNIAETPFIISSSGVMVRSDILPEVGLFDETLKSGDDWDMWLRIVHAGYQFDYVDAYLYHYYVHGENITQKAPLLMRVEEMEYILEKYPEVYKNKKNNLALAISFFFAGEFRRARVYIFRWLPGDVNTLRGYRMLLFIVCGGFGRALLKKISRIKHTFSGIK